ncbi:MAG: DUF2461 domain-containing protein [Anaerolineaceae bacterium]
MAQFNLQSVLQFTGNLKQNNNRDWFQEHRGDYEIARAYFEDYVAALIRELSKTEPLADLTPKDCIFRLNRDLRFTKDKTPYKPYMSAYIAPGGRKSRLLGYYVHIEQGNAMLAGGLYEPDTQQLASWRESIDRNPRPFKDIIGNETFRKFFGEVGGERLKTIPRGYPKDHPEADLLRLKTVTVTKHASDSQVSSPPFFTETMETFGAMKPFLQYLDTFL